MEDVTSFFHCGHAESVRKNLLNKAGIPTCLEFRPDSPVAVNSIMAVAPIPKGFDEVRQIREGKSSRSVELESRSGKKIKVPLDLKFLFSS